VESPAAATTSTTSVDANTVVKLLVPTSQDDPAFQQSTVGAVRPFYGPIVDVNLLKKNENMELILEGTAAAPLFHGPIYVENLLKKQVTKKPEEVGEPPNPPVHSPPTALELQSGRPESPPVHQQQENVPYNDSRKRLLDGSSKSSAPPISSDSCESVVDKPCPCPDDHLLFREGPYNRDVDGRYSHINGVCCIDCGIQVVGVCPDVGSHSSLQFINPTKDNPVWVCSTCQKNLFCNDCFLPKMDRFNATHPGKLPRNRRPPSKD
jgi:hypothetical protein